MPPHLGGYSYTAHDDLGVYDFKTLIGPLRVTEQELRHALYTAVHELLIRTFRRAEQAAAKTSPSPSRKE